MKLLTALFLLAAASLFGAVPSYTVFRGTGGITVTSNPPIGSIVIDGSGIFTSSGTNATIATSTNGVLVAVASTNINFVMGTNVVLTATNTGSTTHIGIHSITFASLAQLLTVSNALVLLSSNVAPAPPLNSVQFNSNGVQQGSADFLFSSGVATVGQGVEVTTGSFVLNGGTTALVAWNGLGRMRWDANGVMRLDNDAALDFNRINLGGTTAAFPAIGRTNGDVIILGANGNFKTGGSTNKLIVPAVYIANDGDPGTPLLRLEHPLSAIKWDLAIDSHPETSFLGLGRVGDAATYAMVWEIGGNVGIGITNPTVRLDVQGRFMARSNVYFPNLTTNATPWNLLTVDSQGEVYETAIATVTASSETNVVLTNLIGTVARNVTNVVSLSTTNATSKPLTNAYANGVLTLFGIEGGANVTITPNGSNLVIAATAGSSSSDTNAVLTNFVGTVGRNVTNFVSLSTSNATSKPLTNSYTAGVVTVFGIEAGANVTATPNGSNIVLAGGALLNNFFAMGISNIVAADAGIVVRTNNGSLTLSNAQSGEITVSGHSNAIPFINGAGNAFRYIETTGGFGSLTNPGFGFNPISGTGPQGGYAGLMVFANESHGLVTIGHPNPGSDFSTFATAFAVSNRYNGTGFKQEMSKYDAVDVGSGSDPSSTFVTYRTWSGTTPTIAAEVRKDGMGFFSHGTMYQSNSLASTMPTAAELGPGGYWAGVSNTSFVVVYSANGTTTSMKVLSP